VTSHDSLSKYLLIMELVLTRFCIPTWVMKILMRAVSNVHVGRIWPECRRFSTTGLDAAYTRFKGFWRDMVPRVISALIVIPSSSHAAANQSSKYWKPYSDDWRSTEWFEKSKRLILQLPAVKLNVLWHKIQITPFVSKTNL